MGWPKGRATPYTEAGIKRMKCIRCGEPASAQWQICADGNRYRPLCKPCDIGLNAMVLTYMHDTEVSAKLNRYNDEAYAEEEV